MARAHSSKRLTQDLFSGNSDGYLSEMFGMTQMNMNSLIK